MHVEASEGNLERTIQASREFTVQMIWVRSSIDILEHILKALKQVFPPKSPTEDNTVAKHDVDRQALQTTVWTENLFRQITSYVIGSTILLSGNEELNLL
jgi:hypothetical protein